MKCSFVTFEKALIENVLSLKHIYDLFQITALT